MPLYFIYFASKQSTGLTPILFLIAFDNGGTSNELLDSDRDKKRLGNKVNKEQTFQNIIRERIEHKQTIKQNQFK